MLGAGLRLETPMWEVSYKTVRNDTDYAAGGLPRSRTFGLKAFETVSACFVGSDVQTWVEYP